MSATKQTTAATTTTAEKATTTTAPLSIRNLSLSQIISRQPERELVWVRDSDTLERVSQLLQQEKITAVSVRVVRGEESRGGGGYLTDEPKKYYSQ